MPTTMPTMNAAIAVLTSVLMLAPVPSASRMAAELSIAVRTESRVWGSHGLMALERGEPPASVHYAD